MGETRGWMGEKRGWMGEKRGWMDEWVDRGREGGGGWVERGREGCGGWVDWGKKRKVDGDMGEKRGLLMGEWGRRGGGWGDREG